MEEAYSQTIRFIREINWNTGFLCLVVVLLLTIAAIFGLGRKKEKDELEIRLQDLSRLWTKDGDRTIHISKLSPLWRDDRAITNQEQTVHFLHERVSSFMAMINNKPWFKRSSRHKAVCLQILQLLDQEGDCPSVVDVQGDVEGSWDDSTYKLLARTSLLDHSLNVAEEAIGLLSENNALHVIPDTMIASLAHDLGKLESIQGYLYSLGEHPLAAGRPLGAIPEFNNIPKKDEILQAIKLHHKKPIGLLGKTLKKADQRARQRELDRTSQETAPKDNVASAETTEQHLQSYSQAAWKAQADIYDESTETNRQPHTSAIPQRVDVSSWFDSKAFLEELKPYINKMFGRRFVAFSMPDGHVYFQAKVLEEVSRKMSEKAGCMELATMGSRDESMRDILFTIVNQLRSNDDVIARGLIKDTFFGGYFTVTRKIGKTIKGYYTPFHAEAFGSIAEMEQAKPKMLRDIIKVSPYVDESTEEKR